MTPTIPIPTDHVYKFHALCGLAILISSMIGLVYLHDRFNERIGKNYLKWEILNRKANLSQEEEVTKAVLDMRLKLDRADRKLMPKALGAIAGIGVVMMVFGFMLWHKKVQPKQDKLLELQIKKIEREILALDKELAETPPGPADAGALSGTRSVTEP
ncbi:MAG TPA: hypothetical protein VGC99_13545 [Candidatus Tectomicrobia bacterium]